MITALPEIKKQKLGPDSSFLIIACDGIWDCLTSQQAVDEFGEHFNKKRENISTSIEDVFDKIIASDVASSGGIGCDNMTCVVI